ncbi:glycosyltransferase family 4 protein [Nocardioides mangrovi]|uniref:Glycosyltransferase family 4 protein n=1 Tax=Nocardioides mangrovi TaxID=2874580 RepID=A0ABS7UIJ9_9ACTN|nr:glycosyltransferase family 4 protein [Nocardioides mangrovi]MBZ5740615.1 glycosyltransferase family 4 protein [Nocardioides mangrovi]
MSVVHLVRPAAVDDPTRPSGGNVYDRRVADALGAVEHDTTATVPDGELALVDGLLLGPDTVAECERVRVVALVHMPRREPWEGAVLGAAAGVIATSEWTRTWLLATYPLEPARVFVAAPGVDAAPLATGRADGRGLLCVGAVTALKGYDVLAAALDALADLDWECVGVGSTEIDPDFAAGLGRTIRLAGPQTPERLAATYAEADLLVLASRAETYGMVVTEALARGLPVVATDVGGVREALGDGGVLVPADDPPALAAALRRWLTDPRHRAELRSAARHRRVELAGWDRTAARVAEALLEVGW